MQTNSDALDVFAESETKNSVAVNNKIHTKGVPGFQGRLSSLFVDFFIFWPSLILKGHGEILLVKITNTNAVTPLAL